MTLDPRSTQNTLLSLKQEIDCKTILSRKLCSTISFNWGAFLINNSTYLKQKKKSFNSPLIEIEIVLTKNPKQNFSQKKITWVNFKPLCCSNFMQKKQKISMHWFFIILRLFKDFMLLLLHVKNHKSSKHWLLMVPEKSHFGSIFGWKTSKQNFSKKAVQVNFKLIYYCNFMQMCS